MPDQHTARESLLGYLYQVSLGLLLLLREGKGNPAVEISIEQLDDVSFELNRTPIQLIQTKHHINNSGSLGDKSVDVWKTLKIWSLAVKEQKIQLNEVILSLISTSRVRNGTAASRLKPDKNRSPAEALKLLSKAGESSKSDIVKDCYETFSQLEESDQIRLLSRVHILDSSISIDNIGQELRKELRLATRDSFLKEVQQRVEGWWYKKVLNHLSSKVIGGISASELFNELNDITEQYSINSLPIHEIKPTIENQEDVEKYDHSFVKQLRIIKASRERIGLSINNYYKAYAHRSRWVREKLLTLNSLEKYESELMQEWYNLFVRMNDKLSDKSTEEETCKAGFDLLYAVEDLQIPIRPKCTDAFIMRGSYHILADELKVGWHSQFRERLTRLVEKRVDQVTQC